MKLAIGCDEAAYALKVEIMKHLDEKISGLIREKSYYIRM